MAKLLKNLVRFSVAAAAVGGICYAFKDQIKESKVYKDNDVDGKINKVKTTIKEKMPKVFDNEADYVEDDEIFFEDADFNPEKASRDYVSINPDASDDATDEKADDAEEAPADDTDSTGDIPTI